MNYKLINDGEKKKTSLASAMRKLWPLVREEKKVISVALVAVVLNSLAILIAPRLIAHAVDAYILQKDFHGVLVYAGMILGLYLFGLLSSYLQTRLMGEVGQRVLFRLRQQIFEKLQSLPLAFFNQNKTGELISRINNDTEKLNQFLSRTLVQFFGNVFLMIGAVIFLLSIHLRLGAATLIPALALLMITRLLSPWIKQQNKKSAESLGDMTAEVQESLQNFKVIIAFNRRDFFKNRFQQVNNSNYSAVVRAEIANNTFQPIYQAAGSAAQLIVLGYGVILITSGQFTIGLLISFLTYATNFYNPLRHVAVFWASFQAALASWDRIHELLMLENNLILVESEASHDQKDAPILSFDHVSFGYPDGKEILHDISINLERGKTYALVGPTGGGKTTTASLMARLYDPTAGMVRLQGRDIRSFTEAERAEKIGFILQDPILFSSSVKENILYGNSEYASLSDEELKNVIVEAGLGSLLDRFEKGLKTQITSGSEGISLGQKQLIAFMRAVLRKPDILILDEATANIDTVTEKLLDAILEELPETTTKIIIAHRLNTIKNVDQIFFVNAGSITSAGSMENALEMLLEHHNS